VEEEGRVGGAGIECREGGEKEKGGRVVGEKKE